MALVIRVKDQSIIEIKLEDGRVINIVIGIISRFRAAAYISAPKTIQINHIKGKEVNDDSRNPSE